MDPWHALVSPSVTQPGQPYPQQPYGQPYGQQPYPAQQPPAPLPACHLRIHLQGSIMTSSMITPTLSINNQVVNAAYGPNDYQMPPGQYHVSAYAQWMRKYGQAALDVVLQPGQTVEVFYAAPVHQFTTGSMGFTKQRRKGGWIMVGLIAVLVLLLVVPLALSLA